MKKSHWITLIVVILLIGVYFIAKDKQPVEKELRFFKADSAAISKVEFYNPSDTIIIEKSGKDWKLTYPIDWEINEQQIMSFFSQVLPIKTSSTPMSEDPGLQGMYKVDDPQAIQVKIYGKSGKLIDHAYIGNGTDTTYDYGRKQGDKKIYQFKNGITNIIRPDVFQWRSPNITNLKMEKMDHIDVVYTKNAYTLTIFEDSVRYTDKRESFTISPYNRAHFKILNALENLQTWQFVDKNTEQYKQAFMKPECKITVFLKDKSVKTFTLIRKVEPVKMVRPDQPQTDVQILMMIDDKITPLYQMTGDFINRFTKASMHFKLEHD